MPCRLFSPTLCPWWQNKCGHYLTSLFTAKCVLKWKLLLVMVVLKCNELDVLIEGEGSSFKYQLPNSRHLLMEVMISRHQLVRHTWLATVVPWFQCAHVLYLSPRPHNLTLFLIMCYVSLDLEKSPERVIIWGFALSGNTRTKRVKRFWNRKSFFSHCDTPLILQEQSAICSCSLTLSGSPFHRGSPSLHLLPQNSLKLCALHRQ